MTETDLKNEVMLEVGRGDTRIFRNNVGVGWCGKTQHVVDRGVKSVIIKHPRPLIAGLCKGSSDLIGWRSVTITPDMVGQKVAIFMAIELKLRTKPSTEQKTFLDAVSGAGGIAATVYSVEDAKKL